VCVSGSARMASVLNLVAADGKRGIVDEGSTGTTSVRDHARSSEANGGEGGEGKQLREGRHCRVYDVGSD